MQDTEEQSAQMLQESHARLQECESQFASAMRDAEAQIAESALAEEHMSQQLYDAHMVFSWNHSWWYKTCLIADPHSNWKLIYQSPRSAKGGSWWRPNAQSLWHQRTQGLNLTDKCVIHQIIHIQPHHNHHSIHHSHWNHWHSRREKLCKTHRRGANIEPRFRPCLIICSKSRTWWRRSARTGAIHLCQHLAKARTCSDYASENRPILFYQKNHNCSLCLHCCSSQAEALANFL